MPTLFEELKRRNVFRVAIAYIVVGWVVMQVAEFLSPLLQLPEWTVSMALYIGILGFPFALLFTWAFELTPEGIKRSHEVHPDDSISHETAVRLNRLMLGLMALIIVGLLADRFLSSPSEQPFDQNHGDVVTVASTSVDAADDAESGRPKSIAVLPFVNMSDDKDYFSDGLSEELLNLLAKIPGLKVAGRTSSFAFKGRNEDLRMIGDALGVAAVLEGSVRKAGDKLRITAQLINVEDGFHIWSNTYDRQMTDIFEIQDDIAIAITEALKIHLAGTAPSLGLPTSNMEAYELYLKAKPLIVHYDKMAEAEQLLLQTVELDPNFAAAWDSLWLVMSNYCAYGLVPCRDILPRGLEYARRAFELDSSLLMARYISRQNSLSWIEGVEALQEIIQLAPNTTRAYDWLGSRLTSAGYFSRAIEVYEAALEIDPYFPDVLPQYATALEGAGRRKESEQTFIHWGDIVGLPHTRLWAAMRYVDSGEQEEVDRYIGAYVAGSGGEAKEIEAYLRELLDPVTRQSAVEDERWNRYMHIPSSEGMWLASFYVFVDDPLVWPSLDRMRQSGIATYAVWQQLLAFSYTGSLIHHPEFERRAKSKGLVELWRDQGLPELCAANQQNWICNP